MAPKCDPEFQLTTEQHWFGWWLGIKWTVFVNVTTKSAQHAHAQMIAIIVEKSPNSSHMYDHGFMDNTNRQAVKNDLIHRQVMRPLHHGGSHLSKQSWGWWFETLSCPLWRQCNGTEGRTDRGIDSSNPRPHCPRLIIHYRKPCNLSSPGLTKAY